ncbi:MAG: GNAT family N-acetyltransferase [Deltaproteobacteria bacterium]|nr:GNAT family N-acetyltransferase [Deltaproteobacteria bacterium]
MLHKGKIVHQIIICAASLADVTAILALQKLAYQSEARLYDDFSIPPLLQTLEELQQEFTHKTVLKATRGPIIIGSVRGFQQNGTCFLERLIVHPDHQSRGLGSALVRRLEGAFPEARRAELFTGHKSERNIRLYERLGYRIFRQEPVTANLSFVFMEKNLGTFEPPRGEL